MHKITSPFYLKTLLSSTLIAIGFSSIISAQKANIEAKEEFIQDLMDRITELEKEIEYMKQL